MSNTKLTKIEKAALKFLEQSLIDQFGGWVTSDSGKVTVAWVPEYRGSKMLRVAVSVASDEEFKIRGKVGRYHALNRLDNGEYIKVLDGVDMVDFADILDTTL